MYKVIQSTDMRTPPIYLQVTMNLLSPTEVSVIYEEISAHRLG